MANIKSKTNHSNQKEKLKSLKEQLVYHKLLSHFFVTLSFVFGGLGTALFIYYGVSFGINDEIIVYAYIGILVFSLLSILMAKVQVHKKESISNKINLLLQDNHRVLSIKLPRLKGNEMVDKYYDKTMYKVCGFTPNNKEIDVWVSYDMIAKYQGKIKQYILSPSVNLIKGVKN